MFALGLFGGRRDEGGQRLTDVVAAAGWQRAARLHGRGSAQGPPPPPGSPYPSSGTSVCALHAGEKERPQTHGNLCALQSVWLVQTAARAPLCSHSSLPMFG